MTVQKDLKRIIRQRQSKTGESYAAARVHVLRERDAILGGGEDVPETEPVRVEAVVLKVNQQSVRVRLLGEAGQITFRCSAAPLVMPGQVATLIVERRWTWKGDTYASGKIENARIDIAKLGLEPLPLEGGDLDDPARYSDGYRGPDPYAPMWKKLTARPRPAYEFNDIAWGAFPGRDEEDSPTADAAELHEAGDEEGARELLMDILLEDIRCIDAHAHLGNIEFDRSPERALVHYEVGIRIGELSLPPGFDGMLPWGHIFNRPFLRSLHGYGLCLWRLRRFAEAQAVFERMLSLNPIDNQGVRFCWFDVKNGGTWEEMKAREEGGWN